MPEKTLKIVRNFWRNPALRLALYLAITGISAFLEKAQTYDDPSQISPWKWGVILGGVFLQLLIVFRAFIDQSISELEKKGGA